MPLSQISFPMYHAERFRSTLQPSKINCIRNPIMTRPKQLNYLRYTGEEAHLCSNGPLNQLYYNRSPYVISDRGSQSGPLFDNKFQALHQCITPSWISHTCQFMREKNLSIKETMAHILLQIQNESFIMESLMPRR